MQSVPCSGCSHVEDEKFSYFVCARDIRWKLRAGAKRHREAQRDARAHVSLGRTGTVTSDCAYLCCKVGEDNNVVITDLTVLGVTG